MTYFLSKICAIRSPKRIKSGSFTDPNLSRPRLGHYRLGLLYTASFYWVYIKTDYCTCGVGIGLGVEYIQSCLNTKVQVDVKYIILKGLSNKLNQLTIKDIIKLDRLGLMNYSQHVFVLVGYFY